jgi:hypothetical protein
MEQDKANEFAKILRNIADMLERGMCANVSAKAVELIVEAFNNATNPDFTMDEASEILDIKKSNLMTSYVHLHMKCITRAGFVFLAHCHSVHKRFALT